MSLANSKNINEMNNFRCKFSKQRTVERMYAPTRPNRIYELREGTAENNRCSFVVIYGSALNNIEFITRRFVEKKNGKK